MSRKVRKDAKLNDRARAAAVKLSEAGKTQVEIAQALGVSQPVISGVLRAFRDTRPEAKERLFAAASDVVGHALLASENAAKMGQGGVALELLDRLDIANKKVDPSKAVAGTRVMVVVGQPNVAALPAFIADSSSPDA